MKQASKCKSRRHYRLLRGKFQNAIANLSPALYESAMNEFRRAVPTGLPY